jgi:hypothetical protein
MGTELTDLDNMKDIFTRAGIDFTLKRIKERIHVSDKEIKTTTLDTNEVIMEKIPVYEEKPFLLLSFETDGSAYGSMSEYYFTIDGKLKTVSAYSIY